MKETITVCAFLSILLSFPHISEAQRTVYAPEYESRGSPNIEMEKVQLEKDRTIVYMIYKCIYPRGCWANIRERTYILEPDSTKQYLLESEGITVAPKKHHLDTGDKLSFKLTFPEIGKYVEKIDIVESEYNAFAFNFDGVSLVQENQLASHNTTSTETGSANVIHMERTKSGLFEVPVTLNDALKIFFILDSGASEVSISPDVALTLMRTRTVKQDDWLEGKYYKFADGTVAKSRRFELDQLRIGNRVLRNVEVSIQRSLDAPMLLGQNVLSSFGKIQIDYQEGTLKIVE